MMHNTVEALRKNKAMIGLLAIVIACGAFSANWDRLSEHRWFRNLTLQTPFHSVSREYMLAGETLVVRGSMVKRRCTYGFLRAYVRSEEGPRRPAKIDDTPESSLWGGGSRPPSKAPEAWGPWHLDYFSDEPPNEWEVWVFHECPDGTTQWNLFTYGQWPRAEETTP